MRSMSVREATEAKRSEYANSTVEEECSFALMGASSRARGFMSNPIVCVEG